MLESIGNKTLIESIRQIRMLLSEQQAVYYNRQC